MAQGTAPPLEAFSRVVESIYDAAMDPTRWQQALVMIADLTASPCAAMGIIDHGRQRHVHLHAHGFEPAWLKVYFEKYAVMNPLMVAGHLHPVGSVYTAASLVDEREFFESRLYREWAQPQGLLDFIGVHALRSGQRSAGLSANRKQGQPRYGKSDVSLFALLAPHVCRAFAISDALDLKTLTSELLQATLDGLTTGVFLLDRGGHVVYMNPVGERQLRPGTALKVQSNRLVAARPGSQVLLAREIANAVDEEAQAVAGDHSVALEGTHDAGYVATVLPLRGKRRRNVSGPFAAAAAVFVQDPQRVPPLPGEAFAKIYGLTAGELRVLLAIAPGLTVREAADMLGISESTSKTHLQRIFHKTGTSKQAELIRLLASSAPPVRSG